MVDALKLYFQRDKGVILVILHQILIYFTYEGFHQYQIEYYPLYLEVHPLREGKIEVQILVSPQNVYRQAYMLVEYIKSNSANLSEMVLWVTAQKSECKIVQKALLF